MVESEREWQAQELALISELKGSPTGSDQPGVAKYRVIVRALRTPQISPMPQNFVSLVMSERRKGREIDDSFERWLLYFLMFLLTLLSVWTIVRLFVDLLSMPVNESLSSLLFIAILLGCLVFTQLMHSMRDWKWLRRFSLGIK